MCTLTEQDYENGIKTACSSTTRKKQIVTPNDKLCKQCGEEVQERLAAGRTQCGTCLSKSLTHKFRATIGKSRAIRRGDSVLIAHSGKANSSVLLRLVKGDENEDIRKKLLLKPKVIYIDDGAVKGQTLEERQTILCSLFKELQELRLTDDLNNIFVISLARCLDENVLYDTGCMTLNDTTKLDTNGDTELRKIFASLKDDTAREELLQQLKRRLLILVARKLNCSKVLLADTLTKLAIKVLANVSTGRGAHILANVGFSDTRCSDIVLARPLKDFTENDVTCYMKLNGLKAILDDSQQQNYFPNSLRSIADRFLYELDREFHRTASTIYRTSEKLFDKHTSDLKKGQSSVCVLCELTLDFMECSENDELSAVQAMSLSREISLSLSLPSCTSSKVDATTRNCQCTNNLYCETATFLQPQHFRRYLCYGCASIFFSSKEHKSNILPSFVSNAIQEQIRLARVREEIDEFLL